MRWEKAKQTKSINFNNLNLCKALMKKITKNKKSKAKNGTKRKSAEFQPYNRLIQALTYIYIVKKQH